MKPLRLILFDCDGTLVDSQHMIAAAMAKAFEDCGVVWPGRAATLRIVGLSIPQAMRVLAPDVSDDQRGRLGEGYRDAFYQLRQSQSLNEPMFPGALDAIKSLSGRDDCLLGIATGKSQRGVRAVIAREGLEGVFSSIQTADDAPSKPHPAMVHQALAETGVDARNCVVVGDTTYDIEMARAAGVGAIGVAWGYHPVEQLNDAGAHVLVDAFDLVEPAMDRYFTGAW